MQGEQFLKKMSSYTAGQLEVFRKRIIEQKYPSTVVGSFVNSRLLNYWIEENGLLEKWPVKGWRKFSFLELVWVKIISDLRKFGVGFDILKKLKEDLFYVHDMQKILQVIREKKEEIKAAASKYRSIENKKLAEFLLMADELEDKNDMETGSQLLVQVMSSVLFRTPVVLMVNSDGEHMFMARKFEEAITGQEGARQFLSQPHVSIPLTGVIEYFILEEEIDTDLKKDILTDDELMIVGIIRKEKPSLLTISFDKEKKVTEIDVTNTTRVELAHRVSDIILKNGYETITLKTQNGKIVTCQKTKKIFRKK